jgi:hypothetical protein
MTTTTYLAITHLKEGGATSEARANTAIDALDAAYGEKGAGPVETGITASTTQTQGQRPLTAALNVVTVCANANDTVTLPGASASRSCTVVNQGAQTLRVYPASGDSIDALGANTATTIAAGAFRRFEAVDGTAWYRVA